MQQQEQIKLKIKAQIQNQLKAINPSFDKPDFINYVFKPIENSSNIIQEGSRLVREIKNIAQQKWKEYIEEKIKAQKENWRQLLLKNYEEHEKLGGSKYTDFLFSVIKSDSQGTKAKEINEVLQNPNSKITPPYWFEFLRTVLNKDLFEKLEKIRRDPQFASYLDYRKKWLERAKQALSQRKVNEIEMKNFKQLEGFIEHLQKRVVEWINKQLYFNFTTSREEYVLNFLEKELESFKRGKESQQNASKEIAAKESTPRDVPVKESQPKDFQSQEQLMKDNKSLPQNQKGYLSQNAQVPPQGSQNFLKQQNIMQKSMTASNQGSSQMMHSTMQPQINAKEQQYQSHLQSQQQSQLPQPHHQQYQHHQHQQHQQQHSTLQHTVHPQQMHQQNSYLQSKHSQYSQQQQSHMNIEHQQPHVSSQQIHATHQQTHPSSQPSHTTVHQAQDSRYQQNHIPNQHHQHQQYLQLSSGSQQSHGSQYQQSQMPTQQHPMHSQQHLHQQSLHPSSQNSSILSNYSQQSASTQVPFQSSSQSHKSHTSSQQPSTAISSHQTSQSHQLPSTQAHSPLSSKHSSVQSQSQSHHQSQPQPQPQHYSHSSSKTHIINSGATSQAGAQQPHSLSSSNQQQQARPHYSVNSYQTPSQTQAQPQAQTQTQSQSQSQMHQTHQQVQPRSHSLPQTQHPSHQSQTLIQNHHQVQHQHQNQVHDIQALSVQKSNPSPKAVSMKIEAKKLKFIEKEKFNPLNFDGVSLEDGERRLGDIHKRLKNPFGNSEIIDKFMKNLYMELAESEVEEKIEKKVKPNPNIEKEVNILPVKNKMMIEEPIPQSVPVFIQPLITNPFEAEINEIKRDFRFKVEDKGNHSSPSFDLVIYKTVDGRVSFHEKIIVRLEKDSPTKIKILEMANLQDFFIDYQDCLEDALAKGKLKQILELWLEFIDKITNKAKSKINALDELFGWE